MIKFWDGSCPDAPLHGEQHSQNEYCDLMKQLSAIGEQCANKLLSMHTPPTFQLHSSGAHLVDLAPPTYFWMSSPPFNGNGTQCRHLKKFPLHLKFRQ